MASKEVKPVKVRYANSQNPLSSFDLIRLEELLKRDIPDHAPDQLHVVQFYLIIFITQGHGRHTVDFIDYEYEKGTIITVRKDQIQKFFKPSYSNGIVLLFTDDFVVSYLEKLEALKGLQLFNDILGRPKIQLDEEEFVKIGQLIKRIESEYKDVMDDFSLGIIRSELHILITQLLRIKSRRNEMPLEKKYLSDFIVLQRLAEQSVLQTTRVSQYARWMGKSTKTLNTICKNIVGQTAKEFIDGICITQIKRILLNTNLSIKEVAYESGFNETTNFYKYFKHRVHKTPEHYRNSFKSS